MTCTAADCWFCGATTILTPHNVARLCESCGMALRDTPQTPHAQTQEKTK
jgi:hypothetical protein